ncbi:MAG: putative excinuclease subunit domain protein [Candidatus Saccharibacteria bacterium]|nr:putative excinuclease subunit domain protein [Candidatus Saccharibacteria bacterium]
MRLCQAQYNNSVNSKLEAKLKTLPRSPGVYFHKSQSGEIIYVGKAAVLRNRVRQYFQSTRDMDVKTRALVAEIADTDWTETESELDALFLESEMVKRYMPRFNILLRDDKSQTFVRIDMKSDWPTVSFTRNPADDGANYYGPYYNGLAVKKALRYLRKVFPYYTKPPQPGKRLDLDFHLGLSPSPNTQPDAYKASLRQLVRYIEGGRQKIVRELESHMHTAAKQQEFELAANYRNKLRLLKELQQRIMFGDREFLDISKDQALSDLMDLLSLPKIPSRIEGYDISHMGGTNVVASMVVFSNGVSDRANYRKFKTKIEHNNDFYNMKETLLRRLSEKNIKAWGVPDLILIDGGKGQLDAALQARDERGLTIPFIGIAKREEQIVIKHGISRVTLNKEKLEQLSGYRTSSDEFTLVNLPHSTHVIKLLQRIRDESHRFAVSYHSVLKRSGQTSSSLEDVPGIGPATRKKLIKRFGSLRGVKAATLDELTSVIGGAKAEVVRSYLQTS